MKAPIAIIKLVEAERNDSAPAARIMRARAALRQKQPDEAMLAAISEFVAARRGDDRHLARYRTATDLLHLIVTDTTDDPKIVRNLIADRVTATMDTMRETIAIKNRARDLIRQVDFVESEVIQNQQAWQEAAHTHAVARDRFHIAVAVLSAFEEAHK